MLDKYLEYAKGMGSREEVILWLNQIVGAAIKKKKRVDQSEIEHVIDYLSSPAAPVRLMKMSMAQAKESADKWSSANQKKGRSIVDTDADLQTLHQYPDGSKIVKLVSKKAYEREGFFMSHCLGGYKVSKDIEIYSYRDAKNMPHATFEVRRNGGEVVQIKGKGNGPIHPRYILPILDFLSSIGQKPRPSEMKNLGYYHIDQAHHEFVKGIVGSEKYLTAIHGELYANS